MHWPILVLCLLISISNASKPNILFIYLDDFGWRDTSYAGSDFYETPNIDALAKNGPNLNNSACLHVHRPIDFGDRMHLHCAFRIFTTRLVK